MDYETADGSQFSLQEVFEDDHDRRPRFRFTSITAFVDGKAFAGKTESRMHDVDDVDIVNFLQPVPPENINPLFPANFTKAPTFQIAEHYLKAPAFTYEDSEVVTHLDSALLPRHEGDWRDLNLISPSFESIPSETQKISNGLPAPSNGHPTPTLADNTHTMASHIIHRFPPGTTHRASAASSNHLPSEADTDHCISHPPHGDVLIQTTNPLRTLRPKQDKIVSKSRFEIIGLIIILI